MQCAILKKSNFDEIKNCEKLESTNMCLTELGKKFFRPTDYSSDSKFETSIFVIKDNSIDSDLIIGTNVIHQYCCVKNIC